MGNHPPGPAPVAHPRHVSTTDQVPKDRQT